MDSCMFIHYLKFEFSGETVGFYSGDVRFEFRQRHYYYYYYYLTAVELTPGGSSTVHIYTQTVHRIQRTEHT
jgi:hypothetical protein